ncbi:hypothetical protein [Paenibacillus alginolyticus]|nr:hypothetical protein [Paenibacillus frigoriresistens]
MFYIVKVGIDELAGELAMFDIDKVADWWLRGEKDDYNDVLHR